MTVPTNLDMTAADYLKYAAALLNARTDWACDSIAGAICDGADGHEVELDAINDAVREVQKMAALFGYARKYSDGRRVVSYAEIQPGLVTSHVWHPDAAAEERTSWRSSLPSDPGEPSPGVYEVSLEPATQEIFVRVVRSA